MALNALWFQPASGDPDIGVPASLFRQAIQGLTGGATLQGLINPVSAVVTQHGSGPDFTLDVQPFAGVIAGDDIADQGTYPVINTAVVNVSTFDGGGSITAPGSGTRTHRLVLQIRDKRANVAWSTYDCALRLLQDTGSGEQAEPPSALTLAHVSISAGQSFIANSNITQGYPLLEGMNRIGPWRSSQNNPGSWNQTSNWTDFTGGQWPAQSFVVPPSGAVWITISGGLINVTGNNSIGWRISGTDAVGGANNHAFGTSAVGTNRGSRRHYVSGLTPGATNTVTPQWFQTSAGNSDTGEGQLTVEAV